MNEKSVLFSETLWSLLQYYQSGPRETLSRAVVARALEFAGISATKDELSKIKSFLFKRLQDFGFIDVLRDGSSNWTSLGNGLIPLSKKRALIFGSKQYQERIVAGNQATEITQHTLYKIPVIKDIDLALMLPVTDIPIGGFPQSERFYSSWGDKIERFLPSSERIRAEVLEQNNDPTVLPSLTNLERLDLGEFVWTGVDAADISNHFFRRLPAQERIGQRAQSFIMAGNESQGQLFEVARASEDWGFFAACGLLGFSLNWTYSAPSQCLFVPQKQLPFLPGLIRRLLCTASMTWPRTESRLYRFDNIPTRIVSALSRKYPFLSIASHG